MSVALVPVHPEPVAGDERSLRWVVPVGTFPFVGSSSALPPVLRALLDDGTLTALDVEPTAVRTALAGSGRGVRRAHACAACSRRRSGRPPAGRRRRAARPTTSCGPRWKTSSPERWDYVRSHGGAVEVLEVRDGRVQVRLSGACAHCPASDLTLTERVETAVRERCPQLRQLRQLTALTPERPAGARRGVGVPRRR